MGNETARLQATLEPKHMKESRFLSMAEPNEWLTNEWLLPNNSWLLPNKLACQRYMFAVQLRWLLFDFRWQRHAVNVCFSSKVVSFQHQDMQKTRRTSEVVRAAFFSHARLHSQRSYQPLLWLARFHSRWVSNDIWTSQTSKIKSVK